MWSCLGRTQGFSFSLKIDGTLSGFLKDLFCLSEELCFFTYSVPKLDTFPWRILLSALELSNGTFTSSAVSFESILDPNEDQELVLQGLETLRWCVVTWSSSTFPLRPWRTFTHFTTDTFSNFLWPPESSAMTASKALFPLLGVARSRLADLLDLLHWSDGISLEWLGFSWFFSSELVLVSESTLSCCRLDKISSSRLL